MTRTALVVAALVATHATCSRCGGGDAAQADADVLEPVATKRIGSCDRVARMSVCSEYAGLHLAQNEPFLTASCSKLGGTFVHAECPNTAVLGSCALSTGEVRKFYGSGDAAYDAARAESECEGSYRGSWKPFP